METTTPPHPFLGLAELKWARDVETFAWTVFDALKMAGAQAAALAESCFTVVGAPSVIWKASTCAGRLLSDGTHNVPLLIDAYDGNNALFSEEVAWPTELPAHVETVIVADAPILCLTGLWKLRCVRVAPVGDDTVQLAGRQVIR